MGYSGVFPQEKTDQSKKTSLVFRPLVVVLSSVIAAALLVAVGSWSDICLGDEYSHLRQARVYAQTGSRIPYDSLFLVDGLVGPRVFSPTPLWHAGLAVLWRVTGTESQTLAQIYQAGFYLLLLLSVYFGVRRIWGDSAASWAWLLIATMPMVCAYSILLYQDVPGIAVSALGLLLLFRKNFLWAGVCLATAYMTKMNMLSYAPWAVVFAAWWSGGVWRRRLTAALLVASPVVMALGYDMAWRLVNYRCLLGSPIMSFWMSVPENIMAALKCKPKNFVRWNPDTIYQGKTVVTNLGIPVIICSFFAIFRSWDRIAKWLWVCLLLCVVGFFGIFVRPGFPQVRYAFPAFPVLVMLGGKGLACLRLSGWLKVMIVAGCMVQAGTTCVYVFHQRRISEWDKAAYAWIRENTSEDAWIMCPEQVLSSETGRPFFWGWANPSFFMTEATDDQRQELLTYFRVSHIAIPLRRVYDREKEGDHAGGYARDFVEKARTLPYLEKVYENPGYLIFKFNPQTRSAADGPFSVEGGLH